MKKILHIARYEYIRLAKKKNFIIALLSVPIVTLLIFGLTYIVISSENPKTPVGYVDKAGFLKDPIPAPKRSGSPNDPMVSDPVPMVPFSSEDDAQKALDSKTIQAYYVIKEDYGKSNEVELFYYKQPGGSAQRQFRDFMQINKIRHIPAERARRAVSGPNLIIRWPKDSPGGAREFSEKKFFSIISPFFLTIAFFFLILMSAGYLMNAFHEEKENRTMEIMITSISYSELIRGKVLGILCLTLTQAMVWLAFGFSALLAGKLLYGFDSLQNFYPDPGITLKMLILAIPTYIMVSALMLGVGSIAAEHREAQQMTMFIMFPMMSSFWLAGTIIKYPDGPLALFMSFFPLTSLSTLGFRITFSPVPLWQIGVSMGILVISALGSIWAATRLFRYGILRYGKKVNWREIFSRRLSHE
jgi:ABC-2 type transport system permease protein